MNTKRKKGRNFWAGGASKGRVVRWWKGFGEESDMALNGPVADARVGGDGRGVGRGIVDGSARAAAIGGDECIVLKELKYVENTMEKGSCPGPVP
jgi:hypothetical protein